jgi:transcriptional regulator with XRE-family HTH domain
MPPPRATQALASIAANVARLRVARGLTQEQLAELVEVDLRHLSRVERAGSDISVTLLVALACALEVPPSRLLRTAILPAPRRGRPPAREAKRPVLLRKKRSARGG